MDVRSEGVCVGVVCGWVCGCRCECVCVCASVGVGDKCAGEWMGHYPTSMSLLIALVDNYVLCYFQW